MLTVTKRFKFDAAHHLPNYDGKCHNLHGHTYRLEVTVTGDIDDAKRSVTKGMVIDFHDLSDLVKRNFIDKYDHGNLNDFFDNPTAEVMVSYIGKTLESVLPRGISLIKCNLWETEDCYASYVPDVVFLKYGDNDTAQSGAQPVLREA